VEILLAYVVTGALFSAQIIRTGLVVPKGGAPYQAWDFVFFAVGWPVVMGTILWEMWKRG
jgi:hypothetical protein